MLDLIKNIENNVPMKLIIPDNEFDIFKNEYIEYKQNLKKVYIILNIKIIIK